MAIEAKAQRRAPAKAASTGPKLPFDQHNSVLAKSALDDQNILSGRYWGELRTFLAVAKAKSLTKAAEHLDTSHMTVGREIRRLQDMTGSQLVTITKTGVSLTPRGVELARALLRFDHTLFSLTNDLRAEKQATEGVVRLGVTDGLGVVFLIPALHEFSARFPRIQAHIKSPGNLHSLRENQADVMLGFVPEQAADVHSEPLGWLHFLPVASSDYIDRKGLPTMANIEQHDFIDSEIYASQSGVWTSWHRLVKAGRTAHFCDTSISYGMMVKAGLGIGLLSNYNMIEPRAMPLDLDCLISLRLYLTGLTERLDSKPVKACADLLRDLFGPHNPWFAETLNLECTEPRFNAGYELLFNLDDR